LSSRVEFSSRIVESSFSIRLECLNSTSQLNSTLFQKDFNSIRHFSSRVLNSNSSTRLDAISLHVIQKDQKIETKIYMNINIKMNVISQRFIIKQDMSLLNVDLSRSIWMNDQNVYCYDVYKMCYRLKDSWNIEKKNLSIFYAIDKKESFLILNMSSMQFKCI